MSNLEASYKLILKELIKISKVENFYFKPRKPKLSDLELISLIILVEFKSIYSEYQLFREIKDFDIASKIERSVYNRRKRKLFPFIEEIRLKMVEKFNDFENYFIVDSMPLEVCKLARSSHVLGLFSIRHNVTCCPSVFRSDCLLVVRLDRHTLCQVLACVSAGAKRSSRTPKIIYRIVSNCKCVWLLAVALFCLYLISVFNFQSFIPIRFRINIPLILYNKMLVFLKSSTFTLSRLP